MIAIALLLASSSPLAGDWRTGCMPIGKGGRHGFVTTLHVAGKMLTARAQLYAHANCDTPTVHLEYRARLAKLAVARGGVSFDQVVTSLRMTPDAPDVVAIYNSDGPGSGCGFGGGWRLGVARDVAGRSCAPWTYPAARTRLYERAWIDGDTLRLGSFPAVWNNTAPALRPAAPGGMTFTRVKRAQ